MSSLRRALRYIVPYWHRLALVVALTDPLGNPVPNRPVIFKVTQNDGLVATGSPAAISATATTDGQGQAQVLWTLGMRAGAGGNTVEAYGVGFGGTGEGLGCRIESLNQ